MVWLVGYKYDKIQHSDVVVFASVVVVVVVVGQVELPIPESLFSTALSPTCLISLLILSKLT